MIRFYTKTNSVTFPDSEMLPLVNSFMTEEIASKIIESDNGMYQVPYTFNLVANQREYAIGDDVLNRIHKVEVKFTADDDRLPATYIKDYRGAEDEDQVVANFTNSEGGFAYTIRRRAILLLSGTIISVTGGVRMVSLVYPEKLANLTDNGLSMEVDPSTTTFGFPRQFHELLARRVSIAWKGSQPKPVKLSPDELKYDRDLALQIIAVSTTNNEGLTRSTEVTDEDTGNDGYDYQGITVLDTYLCVTYSVDMKDSWGELERAIKNSGNEFPEAEIYIEKDSAMIFSSDLDNIYNEKYKWRWEIKLNKDGTWEIV